MTPEQIAKSGTEHGEQAALFAWAAMARLRGFEAADRMEAYASSLEDWMRIINGEGRGVVVGVPQLRWLHAIPSGGSRGDTAQSRKIRGSILKAEGVKKGIADVFLPVPTFEPLDGGLKAIVCCGLYIEMKRKDGNQSDLSQEQREFAKYCELNGYSYQVAFGWRKAADIIINYLGAWKK